MTQLPGKVAVVAGGASLIGLAIVGRFVEEGARVVVGDRNGAPPALRRDADAG